jgi:hypothetical protein
MKKLAAKFLRGFAYVWLTQATLLILSTVAFEFYSGGFWHGWNTYAVWFSPFNCLKCSYRLAWLLFLRNQLARGPSLAEESGGSFHHLLTGGSPSE